MLWIFSGANSVSPHVCNYNIFDGMANHIYTAERQFNKANVADTDVSYLDLHLSISDGFVTSKIYDK